jgi:hypothetical protein
MELSLLEAWLTGVGVVILVTYRLLFGMAIQVEEYISEDGSIPYRDWFESLHAQAAAKVATAVLRMEMGNTSNVKWFDGIGNTRSTGVPATVFT